MGHSVSCLARKTLPFQIDMLLFSVLWINYFITDLHKDHLSAARLVSCWLPPRALSHRIGLEIWASGWPQTQGMFCLDVHSGGYHSDVDRTQGLRASSGLMWNKNTSQRGDGQNWNCWISASKTFEQAVLTASFFLLSIHSLSCLCCQETQREQVSVCADQVRIFNSKSLKAGKPETSGVIVISTRRCMIKREPVWSLLHINPPCVLLVNVL